MEVIHCFNFIMLFLSLVLLIGNLIYSVQISLSLVKIFEYMKKIGTEEDEEEEIIVSVPNSREIGIVPYDE